MGDCCSAKPKWLASQKAQKLSTAQGQMGVKRTNHFELSSRWSSRVSWRFMERWSNSYLILELQSHFGRAGLSPKWQPFISPHDKQRFFPTWEPETLNLDGLDWGDGKAKILCQDKTYIYISLKGLLCQVMSSRSPCCATTNHMVGLDSQPPSKPATSQCWRSARPTQASIRNCVTDAYLWQLFQL